MASKQGTVTADGITTFGHELLLDELITFLTTDTDLVAAGQNWTVLKDTAVPVTTGTRDVYLRGPGLAGNDQIYVVIRRYTITNVTKTVFNWQIYGAQGFDDSSGANIQPGSSLAQHLILYDESIPYWFFANGRRFIVNARILTFHSNMYAGLYLPFGTSAELPYPMAILGSTDRFNWSYLEDIGNDNSSGFFNPKTSQTISSNLSVAPGAILRRDGVWVGVLNEGVTTNDAYRLGQIWPYSNTNPSDRIAGYYVRSNEDNTINVLPVIMLLFYTAQRTLGAQYGELDGVKWISGGPYTEQEDIIQIGSDNYRVIGDFGKIGLSNLCAILED